MALGVIPARFASSRFPGKALVPIDGQPLIAHVWRGARASKRLREVLVATDDERIARTCDAIGARWVMTRRDHPTGTDRVAEVARSARDEIVVNIQGDEPLMAGFVIDAVVDALAQAPADVPMATLVHEAEPGASRDPHRVKVALDQRGFALYFSRSSIPALRAGGEEPTLWQHVGLYAYRQDFLAEFVALERTPAERAEGLEQLRALEHGWRIRCAVVEGWRSVPVDVPADVPRVEARLLRARPAATRPGRRPSTRNRGDA